MTCLDKIVWLLPLTQTDHGALNHLDIELINVGFVSVYGIGGQTINNTTTSNDNDQHDATDFILVSHPEFVDPHCRKIGRAVTAVIHFTTI